MGKDKKNNKPVEETKVAAKKASPVKNDKAAKQAQQKEQKQSKKRKLEEREEEEEATIENKDEEEEATVENKDVEAGEEEEEAEPVQKKTKGDGKENSSDETVHENAIIPLFLRVNGETLMKTLTKELKVDVNGFDATTSVVTLNSSKQRNKLLSNRVVRIGTTDVVFSKPLAETVDKHGLFVSNISVKVTIDVLKSCFKEIAPVKDIHFVKKRKGDMGQEAIVLFKKPVTDEALDYNGAPIEDRNIHVRFLNEADKRAFIKNVASDVTNEELLKYVSECGTVEFIAKIEHGNQNKFCVQFDDYKSALELLEYNGADIHGKAISVSRFETSEKEKPSKSKLSHRSK
jgi:hypothetical protein